MNVVAKVRKKSYLCRALQKKYVRKMKRDLKLLIETTGKKAKEGKHELEHDLEGYPKVVEASHQLERDLIEETP